MAPLAGDHEQGGRPGPGDAGLRRVLVVAAGTPSDADLIGEVRGEGGDEVEVAVVVPVVEPNPAKRVAGELEPARDAAERRLEDSLARLRNGGLAARGEIGDTDPILAAEDALRQFPADEVLVFEESGAHARWFEEGLLERAEQMLDVPLRMLDAGGGGAAPTRPVAERAAAEAEQRPERELSLAPYLPAIAGDDLAAVTVGVVGTILAAVFFAAGPGTSTTPGAVQGLLALAAVLINIAHAVAITIFESVRYRGGFQSFVRDVTLVFTPVAMVANLIILLVA